jgi:hypothetical protein
MILLSSLQEQMSQPLRKLPSSMPNLKASILSRMATVESEERSFTSYFANVDCREESFRQFLLSSPRIGATT